VQGIVHAAGESIGRTTPPSRTGPCPDERGNQCIRREPEAGANRRITAT
jgi:hypothetical protein